MKYESLARTALPLLTVLALLGCGEDTKSSDEPVMSATTPDPTSPMNQGGAGPSSMPSMPMSSAPGMSGGSGGASPGGAGMGGIPGMDGPGGSGSGMGGSAMGGSAMGGSAMGGSGMGGSAMGGSGMGGNGVAGSAGSAMGGASGMGGDASMAGSGGASGGEFTLMSAEFMDGAELPEAHTCASPEGFQGAPSPSFSWSGAPEGTQSYAMVMMDKTLVDMGDTLGYHSAFWNVPASVTSLPVDLATAPEIMAAEVINRGYLGPCPTLSQVPVPHVYTFTLYALPEAMVDLPGQVNAAFVEELEGMALATAVLSCESSASM